MNGKIRVRLSFRARSSETILKISLRDVEEAIQTMVSNSILVSNKLSQRDSALLDEIIYRFTKRNKKQETVRHKREETAEEGSKAAVPATVYFTTARSQTVYLSNLILQGAIHDKARTRVRKFYREEALQGPLLSLDLAVAFQNGAIDKNRASEIMKKDLKSNAKSGYEYCQDWDLTKFKAIKDNPEQTKI
jgi:hypothetical protein